MAGSELLERKDVPAESKWNSEAVFASWAAWKSEAQEIESELPQLSEFEETVTAGPGELADWLETVKVVDRRIMRLMVYVFMSNAVDAGDVQAKENIGLFLGLWARFQAATAFAEPMMLQLGDQLLKWAKEEERLHIYEQYFHNLLRLQEHKRSAEVEELLGMVSEPFNQVDETARELSNLDMKFRDARDSKGESHPVTQATLPPSGIQDADRERRRSAWESFYDGYLDFKNTLASNYIACVKQNLFLARARGYDSVLEYKLSPSNLPLEVFHNLIATFQANIGTWHRFWDVKRRLLGLDKLHPYDIWAPITEQEPSIPYQEGVELICAGLQPLGADYVAVMRQGCLQDGWVDYAPNVGKSQGAASGPSYDTPPFIFMGYDETIGALSTLAHELGHSMHSYLIDQNQPHVYNDFDGLSMTAAETASNFHQAMVRAHLMKSRADDRQFQLALIAEAMDNFHRYFFIMPMLARFEFEVFTRAENGLPLSADILNKIMSELYAEGYGETMSDDPRRTAITWAQFMHLYSPFYTFQYAIGISAAHALADGILAGRAGAVQDYLNFLKAGSSVYTMDLFKLGGVDMAQPDAVHKAFAVLSGLVDRLDELA